jgi:hypothetical protein
MKKVDRKAKARSAKGSIRVMGREVAVVVRRVKDKDSRAEWTRRTSPKTLAAIEDAVKIYSGALHRLAKR